MTEIYTTSGVVQYNLTNSYILSGKKKNFIEVVKELYNKKDYFSSKPKLLQNHLWSRLSDHTFIDLLAQLPIHMGEMIKTSYRDEIRETDILPENSDIFVFKHFNFLKNDLHTHNYFEICYVFRGCCELQFEKETRTLVEGQLCIIAPMSLHDIVVNDATSVIIMINIRKSTFDKAFFTILSQKDLLSYFFKTILYNQTSPNYLLFFTENKTDIKMIIKNLVMENYREDMYQNNCCISWTNILFSSILRNNSKTIQFSNYKIGADFSLILQYIQQNYRTVSLAALAKLFHYSEAHLSTIIKKNTGLNFTTIVTKLKMSDALELLENTDLPVEKMAELIGYHSVDHFSRTFKRYYHMPPQQFRKLQR